MKAQLSNSKIAIIKAKEAYNANKSAQKRRVSEEHEEQEQWENVREETEVRNRNLFETEYKVNPNRYMFEDSENKPKNINLSQTARPKEKPPLNFNSTGSKKRDSSKKKEIVNLRKQIEELTQEMKNKQRSQLPLTQKMRQCEQIKRRYKNKDKNESEEERQVIETPYKNIQMSSKTINRTSSK